jgi:integrase
VIHEINLSDNLACLNGAHLDRLMEAYLADRLRRVQAKTVAGYRFKLRPFLDWWRGVGPSCNWLLSEDDLADYETYLQTMLNWAWSTRSDALRRLRQMFRWAHKRGHVAIDFSLYVPTTRGAPTAKTPVDINALAQMLEACWKMGNPLRNRTVIAILAGTGLRREECASLRVESITIMADGAGYLDPSVTKNDKPRLVAFDAATGEYIKRWLDVLGKTSGPLFPSRKGGGALSPDGVYKVVMDAALLAGVDAETHDLRRMFATVWSRTLRGESYGQLLQKQLGHANYETTTLYSLQDVSDVLDVMRKTAVSPLALLQRSTE